MKGVSVRYFWAGNLNTNISIRVCLSFCVSNFEIVVITLSRGVQNTQFRVADIDLSVVLF